MTMDCNRGFRIVYQYLLLASFLAYAAASDAPADEGTPPVQEKPAAQSQVIINNAGEVKSAPTVTMLTLSQCIDIALRKNPTILAALYSVDVNKSRVGEARSAYYPQVSAQGSYDRLKLGGTNVSPTQGTTTYNEYIGIINLKQTILDFGKTSSSVDISKFNLESASSN